MSTKCLDTIKLPIIFEKLLFYAIFLKVGNFSYLSMADTGCIILPKCKYEAPALFRVDDLYFGLFSGCTSWDSNRSRYAWGRCLLD